MLRYEGCARRKRRAHGARSNARIAIALVLTPDTATNAEINKINNKTNQRGKSHERVRNRVHSARITETFRNEVAKTNIPK